jgi:flagellar biosynthesis protein FlhG
MSKLKQDQAAGLRKLMAIPAPRIFTMLSASSTQDKSRLMTNLAASMATQGTKSLVIHASKESSESVYGINALPTLLETNKQKNTLQNAIYLSKFGFSIAKLMQKSQLHQQLSHEMNQGLGFILKELASAFEIVLVDASVDDAGLLPIDALNSSEIIVQLTRKPESIKEAYALIKKVYSQLGRRNFGIIVDDATDAQAQVVFNNISKVAKQYMQIDLTYFGAIPADDHLSKAVQLGRAVVDAFPLAQASTAFKKMAMQLESSVIANHAQGAFI